MLKRDSVLSTHTFGREKINADIALYMTLWYLLNTVTFRQISDRFGVPKSSARRIITKVINYLVKAKTISYGLIKVLINRVPKFLRKELE